MKFLKKIMDWQPLKRFFYKGLETMLTSQIYHDNIGNSEKFNGFIY